MLSPADQTNNKRVGVLFDIRADTWFRQEKSRDPA
jgi:hypothetical protein